MSLSTSLPSPPPVLSEDPDEIDEESDIEFLDEEIPRILTDYETNWLNWSQVQILIWEFANAR